jgi:BirA family biotin operon repressor/biotin-[acetyl-CoA-carboxylase] ligase
MKEKILERLRTEPGKYVSGEEISHDLGVSRTAIWKHVQSLRDDGYEIESSRRLGYRLAAVSDRMLPTEIQRVLHSRVFGQKIHHFRRVSSTNLVAREMAREGTAEGTLVVAEEQTHGRGRLGREWVSPAGTGIWMSLILRPSIPPTDAPRLTLAAAVAVADAVGEIVGISPEIKWPNDLLFGGKKFCGILTEMDAEMERVNFVILGIGINVNQLASDFPEPLRSLATSLRETCGRRVSRPDLVCRILERLEDRCRQTVSTDFEQILTAWRANSTTLGRPVTVTSVAGTIEGLAEDVDADGSLLVRLDNGVLQRVMAGEVTLRRA